MAKIVLFLSLFCVLSICYSQETDEPPKEVFVKGRNGHTYRKLSPNQRFRQCCMKDKGKGPVGDKCLSMCNYAQIKNAAAIGTAIATQSCEIADAEKIMYCASRFEDHSKCCAKAGVPKNCLDFCKPAVAQATAEQALLGSAECPMHYAKYMKCFQDYEEENLVWVKVPSDN